LSFHLKCVSFFSVCPLHHPSALYRRHVPRQQRKDDMNTTLHPKVEVHKVCIIHLNHFQGMS
jgi:hypothetical protein